MKGYLLDINILLALAWPNHVHHSVVHQWFANLKNQKWATCTISQLGFVRLSSHPSFTIKPRSPIEARHLLQEFSHLPNHQFWSEPPKGLLADSMNKIFEWIPTHASVTDGYLVAVAKYHGGKVATLDQPLVGLFPQDAEHIL